MAILQESVNGIIFSADRKQVLLIKRRDVPVWVLPGGGIEEGEDPERATIREVKEETGFSTKILRKVAEYTPKCCLASFTHLFECTILSGSPTIGSETQEIRFFPLSNLPKRLPPPYPDWIKDSVALSPLLKKPITSVTYYSFCKHLLLHPILVTRFLLSKIIKHLFPEQKKGKDKSKKRKGLDNSKRC